VVPISLIGTAVPGSRRSGSSRQPWLKGHGGGEVVGRPVLQSFGPWSVVPISPGWPSELYAVREPPLSPLQVPVKSARGVTAQSQQSCRSMVRILAYPVAWTTVRAHRRYGSSVVSSLYVSSRPSMKAGVPPWPRYATLAIARG
jgi:hypothetical protein